MHEEFAPELTKKEEGYRKKVQSKINYCSYCQPYDGGEFVWIFGDQIELDELMDSLNIDEKHRENIYWHLGCPNCGNSEFDACSLVGLKTKFEIEIENHIDKALKLFGKKIKKFNEELELAPFLAYKNSFGKQIYKEIKDNTLPIISAGGVYFRSRSVTSSEVFDAERMKNAPLGKPLDGRFNHSGQSHLYLANDKETAIREVASNDKPFLVWIQKFLIKKTVDKILDLSFDWDFLTPSTSILLLSMKLTNSLIRSDRNNENWKPDYYLTRYIMDCAKELGYNGIKYNSAKEYRSYNLVLFYPESIDIVLEEKPKIEIFDNKNQFDNVIN
ncbi:MAG: RES family NAD+ phosphorylase [Flavobacteriaceae bacterium]